MSKNVVFHFRKPGLQTLVQDHGRIGQQAFGVPEGGVMDRSSSCIANWLVGNQPNAPVLEMTMIGPEIEIEGDCQIALTGADISPMLDDYPAAMYKTLSMRSGSKLSFGPIKNGCRAYLAIRGKWMVKKWLESQSAFLLGDQDLTPDSIPTKGSMISIRSIDPISTREFAPELRPNLVDKTKISVLPGPEFNDFSEDAVGYFFKRGHKITADSNRMGYRLDTELPGFNPENDVISSGIVKGTIQVTISGQPIILMADAQTTGGYPRLANVITAHLDKLAQLKPGDEIRFSLVDLKIAYQALWDREATLKLVLG